MPIDHPRFITAAKRLTRVAGALSLVCKVVRVRRPNQLARLSRLSERTA
jgi:hypothetical protein